MLHSYPKVYAVGHRNIRTLFLRDVLVQEKLDGSQISFGLVDGQLHIRSHHAEIQVDAPDKTFAPAVQHIVANQQHMEEGVIFRAEAICRPKHNTFGYNRTPDGYLVLFDVDDGHEDYASYEVVCHHAALLGIEVTPRLFQGQVDSSEQLREYLETESFLGGPQVEGIVIKSYDQFGIDGRVVMGKLVSEAFKEVHNKSWKERTPGKGNAIERIKEMYRNENRWAKAVQARRDAGELQDAPEDIGPLMVAIHKDVYDECADEIKEKLFQWAWKEIARGLTAGFPEYYKNLLADQAFDADMSMLKDEIGYDKPLPEGSVEDDDGQVD